MELVHVVVQLGLIYCGTYTFYETYKDDDLGPNLSHVWKYNGNGKVWKIVLTSECELQDVVVQSNWCQSLVIKRRFTIFIFFFTTLVSMTEFSYQVLKDVNCLFSLPPVMEYHLRICQICHSYSRSLHRQQSLLFHLLWLKFNPNVNNPWRCTNVQVNGLSSLNRLDLPHPHVLYYTLLRLLQVWFIRW